MFRSNRKSGILTVTMTITIVVSCSGRTNNFGSGTDAGDVGTDMYSPAPIGEVCDAPDECTDDALCIGTNGGDSLCMATCETDYEICAGGAVCLPVVTQDDAICYIGGDMMLRQQCENNLDCAAGLLCFGVDPEFYCRRACDGGVGTCADGEFCRTIATGAGLCRSEVGAECATSLGCADGLDCTLQDDELGPFFPGGACTRDCDDDDDCRGDAVCRALPGLTRTICLPVCDHVSDCRFNGSYDCLDQSGCGASSDPDGCRAMFGDDSLCVGGVF